MEINKLAKTSDHWSVYVLCQAPPLIPCSVMKRNRFSQTQSFIHYSHPDNLRKEDQLTKQMCKDKYTLPPWTQKKWAKNLVRGWRSVCMGVMDLVMKGSNVIFHIWLQNFTLIMKILFIAHELLPLLKQTMTGIISTGQWEVIHKLKIHWHEGSTEVTHSLTCVLNLHSWKWQCVGRRNVSD